MKQQFSRTLDQTDTILDKANAKLQQQLADIQELSEEQLARINRSGLTEIYQDSIRQGRYLQTWVDLHKLLLSETDISKQQAKQILESADRILTSQGSKANSMLHLLKAIVYRRTGKFQQARSSLRQGRGQLKSRQQIYFDFEQIQLALSTGSARDAEKLASSALEQLPEGPLTGTFQSFARAALLLLQGQSRLAQMQDRSGSNATAADRENCWQGLTQFLSGREQLLEMVCPGIDQAAGRWPPASRQNLAKIEQLAIGLRCVDKKRWQSAAESLSATTQSQLPAALKLIARQMLAKSCYELRQLPQAVNHLLTAAGQCREDDKKRQAYSQAAAIAWEHYASDRSRQSATLFHKATTALLANYPENAHADRYRVLLADALLDLDRSAEAMRICRNVDKSSAWHPSAIAQQIRILVDQNLSDNLTTLLSELDNCISAGRTDSEKADANVASVQQSLIAQAILDGTQILIERQAQNALDLLNKHQQLIHSTPQHKQRAQLLLIQALLKSGTCRDLQQAYSLVNSTDKIDSQHRIPTAIAILEAACRALADRFPVKGDKCCDELTRNGEKLSSDLVALDIDNVDLVNRLQRVRAMLLFHADKIGKSISALTIALAVHSEDALVKLTLARAYLQSGKHQLAVSNSLKLIDQCSPGQRIYFQALLINLKGHTMLNSPPNQISNAIISRQRQFPDLGGPTIKAALLKLLAENQQRLRSSTNQNNHS